MTKEAALIKSIWVAIHNNRFSKNLGNNHLAMANTRRMYIVNLLDRRWAHPGLGISLC